MSAIYLCNLLVLFLKVSCYVDYVVINSFATVTRCYNTREWLKNNCIAETFESD